MPGFKTILTMLSLSEIDIQFTMLFSMRENVREIKILERVTETISNTETVLL